VYGEEKIFFTGPTRAAKAEQHFFVPARQAQRINQASVGNPFIKKKNTVHERKKVSQDFGLQVARNHP
jgi:hypothetical protein